MLIAASRPARSIAIGVAVALIAIACPAESVVDGEPPETSELDPDYGNTSKPMNPRKPGSPPKAVEQAVATLQGQIEAVMANAQVPSADYTTLPAMADKVSAHLNEAQAALGEIPTWFEGALAAIEQCGQRDALLNDIASAASKINGFAESLNTGLANARAYAERCNSPADAASAQSGYDAAMSLLDAIAQMTVGAETQVAQLAATEAAVATAKAELRAAASQADRVALIAKRTREAALSLDSRIMNIRRMEGKQDGFVKALRGEIDALTAKHPESTDYIEAELGGLPAGLSYSRNASRPEARAFDIYLRQAKASTTRVANILQEANTRAGTAKDLLGQLEACTDDEIMGLETLRNASAAASAASERAMDLPALINACASSHAELPNGGFGDPSNTATVSTGPPVEEGDSPPPADFTRISGEAAAAQQQQDAQRANQQARSHANFQQMQQNIRQMQHQQEQGRRDWVQWQQNVMHLQQQQELIRQQQEQLDRQNRSTKTNRSTKKPHGSSSASKPNLVRCPRCGKSVDPSSLRWCDVHKQKHCGKVHTYIK